MKLTHDIQHLGQRLHLSFNIESLTSVVPRVLLLHLLYDQTLVGNYFSIAWTWVDLKTLKNPFTNWIRNKFVDTQTEVQEINLEVFLHFFNQWKGHFEIFIIILRCVSKWLCKLRDVTWCGTRSRHRLPPPDLLDSPQDQDSAQHEAQLKYRVFQKLWPT